MWGGPLAPEVFPSDIAPFSGRFTVEKSFKGVEIGFVEEIVVVVQAAEQVVEGAVLSGVELVVWVEFSPCAVGFVEFTGGVCAVSPGGAFAGESDHLAWSTDGAFHGASP